MSGIRALSRRSALQTLSILGLALASAAAPAGTPHLVLDINAQTHAVDSSPIPLGKLGNALYFIASPAPGGSQSALYKTDGTGGGTTMVKSLGGFGVLTPTKGPLFLAAGTQAYFLSASFTAGEEVWVTDGTAAGTHMLGDLYPGSNGSPQLLGLIGTDLIFAESTSLTNWQIFRSDGTSAGTRPITNFPASSYSGVIESFITPNGKIYMQLQTAGVSTSDLWVSDGNSGNVTQIMGGTTLPFHLQANSFRQFGNDLLLNVNTEEHGSELGLIDPTTDALSYIETAPGPGSGVQYYSTIAVLNGFAVYVGDGADGSEPWRTDGTLAGTTMIKDINPGSASSMVGQNWQVTTVGNYAVFVADDGTHGPQLWSTDGTTQGTVALIAAGSIGGTNSLIGVVGTHAYYVVSTGTDYRMIVTDGTVTGTHQLTDVGALDDTVISSTYVTGSDTLTFLDAVTTAPSSGRTRHLFAYAPQSNTLTLLRDERAFDENSPPVYDSSSGLLLFASFDAATGVEPWVSDGSVAGTHLLQDLAPEIYTGDSTPNAFINDGGELAFIANDGVSGNVPWVSDGTAAGTKRLPAADEMADVTSPSHLTAMNGALYFFSYDQLGDIHLMKAASANSTPEVLAALSPMLTYPGGVVAYYPCVAQDRTAVLNGNLYFVAQAAGSSFELWKTDGTAAGTVALTDQSSNNPSGFPCALTAANGHVYFIANTTSGNQLWTTDGTRAGTGPVVPGSVMGPVLSDTPAVLNGQYYFTADDGTNAQQLWKTDGTAAGTQVAFDFPTSSGSASYVSPVGVLNGKLLLEVFAVSTSTSQLWVSDGTLAGTTSLNAPNVYGSAPVIVAGSKAYFPAKNSGPSGSDPWVTDGTPAGTSLLKALDPQPASSPMWFLDFHGIAVFEVVDANAGYHLWRTDGTSAGTQLIGPVGPPAATPRAPVVSTPTQLVVGQNLFFAATDPVDGTELFALPNDAPVAVSDTATSANDAAVTINVVANDADVDGSINPSSVQITAQAAHGTAVVGTGGTILYTPAAGYSGTDSFGYTVADDQGAVSASGQVNVTVTASVTVMAGGGGGGSSGKSGGGAVDWRVIALLLVVLGARMGRRSAGRRTRAA